MQKTRVAVIGAGRLGSIHTRIYSQMPNVELVGVCDVSAKQAKHAAKAFKTGQFSDYKEVFDKADAVSVAVPTSLHHKIAKDFLDHGIHTLVEKPITNTLEEAQELVRIANENDLILQVGHVERFNSAVMAVEPLVDNPRFIECQRLGPYAKRIKDMGVVLDLMIHDIDIILTLVKSKPVSVESFGANVVSDNDFEDIAQARIKFENGAVANISASRLTMDAVRKIRIFQKDAYISLNYAHQSAYMIKKTGRKISKTNIRIRKSEPLKLELEDFIDCIIKGEKPVVSGEDAVEALRLTLQIQEQIRNQYK